MTEATPPAGGRRLARGCSHAVCLPYVSCQLADDTHTPTEALHNLRRPTLDDILTNRWTAVPNNEIGGWAITTDGRSPLDGGVMAADMVWSREVAEYIAELHNARLRKA